MGEEERNFFSRKKKEEEGERGKERESRKRILTIGEGIERKGRRVARLRLRKAWMDEKTGKRGRRREEERKSWVARRLKKLIGRYERENYKCKTVR